MSFQQLRWESNLYYYIQETIFFYFGSLCIPSKFSDVDCVGFCSSALRRYSYEILLLQSISIFSSKLSCFCSSILTSLWSELSRFWRLIQLPSISEARNNNCTNTETFSCLFSLHVDEFLFNSHLPLRLYILDCSQSEFYKRTIFLL